ncbi:MAG TPA: amino acid adenylation domain-containing protein [Thermoanaerobaculia bacterium]|nr:amino acid adenylation domain-containing protein [Thermoanaerobaculia bacterium]
MNAARLLADLDRLGVRLWAEGDRLCYRSPKGSLTPPLLARLREGKAEILELVRRSEPRPARRPAPPLPAIVPEPARRHEPFPLSDIQQAYLVGRTGLFELGGIGPTSYVEVDWSELNLGRLEGAWNRLVERHDVLRAVVDPAGQLHVLPRVPPYTIAVRDLRGLGSAAVAAERERTRERMSELCFDPERWPLFALEASLLDGGLTRLHVSRDLLIGDARSTEILIAELLALYGGAAALPPLGISIRDYAVAAAALKGQAAYERARSYWMARLPDLPAAPELPLANVAIAPGAPAAGARHRFLRHHGEIAPAAWSRLMERAARVGLTPSALLCAAYAEVLATWSNRRRFVLNLLYANRLPLHPAVDGLVGNFASTILLEVDLREASFERRASRLQEQLWDDLEHSLMSGVELLRELNRQQGRSTRAAMPVVFSSVLPFRGDAPGSAGGGTARAAGGGRAELVWSSVQTPQVALELLVTEVSGEVRYTWNAVDGVFPPGLVADLCDAYERLLRRLADEPAAWQDGSATLSDAQRERRRAANCTGAPEPIRRLHEGIAGEDGAVAVADPRRRLRYGDLHREAGAVERALRSRGASPDRLVAVAMEKGWEQAVAVLGILGAGAAYLPVDPALPRERRWHLLERGEVRVVLTQPRLVGELEWPPGIEVLSITEGAGGMPTPGAPPKERSEAPARSDSLALAYVLFTSGSTGLPKGVMIDHRGAVNTVEDVNRRFRVGPADRVLALSSLSFDLSVWDLFGLLAAGGRIVLPDPAGSRDPAHWHQRMVAEGVTVWNSVPALLEIYADYLAGRGEPLPPSLRLVLLSGDWIPVGLPDRIRALAAGREIEVIGMGGATEASIWSILFPIAGVDPAWRSIPYGKPMANQRFHVLDELLEPCPDWVPGELYIGGIGLAQGYWRDEPKTRASFFVHPRTGERLYRTGDLGRYLPDGNLEFLGRRDTQVKVQGYRVELGEIEAALSRHPAVREAVVAAVGEPKGHKRLVAYVVAERSAAPAAPGALDNAELRAFLETKLPEYMVPSLFVPLPALPLTANGKVDRGALPAPDAAPARRGGPLAEPRSPAELRMTRIWEEVVGVRPVGRTDDFFALGGDSMLGLRLLAAVEKAFGRRLPLSALLAGGTVERLAALAAEGSRSTGSASPRIEMQTGSALREPFFCVHPVGGNVLCYVPLARALGEDQPFHAFEAPGLDGGGAPLATIEELADCYLAALREARPAGPYRLGGWSMGGIVAFEMARRLADLGEEVPLLALVDSRWPPALDEAAADDEAAMARAFAEDVWRSRSATAEPAELAPPERERLFAVFGAHTRAMARYRPRPYGGPVLLVGAAGSAEAAAADWRQLAPALEVRSLPGDHYSLLQPPQVEALAGLLAERLRKERP